MRCPDCGKFVSEEMRAEWNSPLDLDLDNLSADGSIIIYKDCAECGTELASVDADVSIEFVFDLDAHKKEDGCDGEFELVDTEPTLEVEDYYETKDRKGKTIKNPRYQKHMFKAVFTAEIKCSECPETVSDDFETDSYQGSEFNPS